MAARTFLLTIASPAETFFEGSASEVSLPGVEGDFQVLTDHESLITTLKEGDVRFIKEDGSKDQLSVVGGVVEVVKGRCTVLL